MTDDTDALQANAAQHDPEAFAIAQARMKADPIALTDRDFVQLGIVSPRLATEAYEAQRQAQLTLVRRPTAPLVKKSAPETVEEFLQLHGKKPVTYRGLNRVLEDVFEIFKAQKAKMATLEKANTDLQTRVLELEATHAAARPMVEHVEPD